MKAQIQFYKRNLTLDALLLLEIVLLLVWKINNTSSSNFKNRHIQIFTKLSFIELLLG